MINRVSVLEYSCAYNWVYGIIYVPLDWESYVADSQVYMEKVYFIAVYSTISHLTSPKCEWEWSKITLFTNSGHMTFILQLMWSMIMSHLPVLWCDITFSHWCCLVWIISASFCLFYCCHEDSVGQWSGPLNDNVHGHAEKWVCTAIILWLWKHSSQQSSCTCICKAMQWKFDADLNK